MVFVSFIVKKYAEVVNRNKPGFYGKVFNINVLNITNYIEKIGNYHHGKNRTEEQKP